jgi:hypothetical protein
LTNFVILSRLATVPKVSRSEPNRQLQRPRASRLRPLARAAELRRQASRVDPAQQASALQAEYFHLQKTVEDFDGKALTIKAWSITFSMAVLVGAFTSHSVHVFLIASAASLLFWILETLWKSFQLGYYSRIEAIEAYFRDPAKALPPFQVNEAWMNRWRSTPWTEVWGMAWWPHVALPHVVAVAGGLTLFFLAHLEVVRL